MNHRQAIVTAILLVIAMCFTTGSHATELAMADGTGQSAYQLELARLEQSITAFQELSNKHPGSWVHHERLANEQLKRARLSGKVEDYLASQNSLQLAFDIAGEQNGPVLSRASLNFSMHRLPDVEADLNQAEAKLVDDNSAASVIAGLRADVFLQRGQYAAAKTIYEASESTEPTANTAIRLAVYYATLAEFQQAENWFKKAEDRVTGYSPRLRSWLKLQLGILDREQGRWKQAYHHYNAGRKLFTGHWLIEEHIAEIEVLLGYSKKAEKKYRKLVERTESPVTMLALADILNSRKGEQDKQEAVLWTQRAIAQFEASMAVAPELVAGHALDYFLHSGDHEHALDLAVENHKLRPAGKAALALAQAYALQNEYPRAVELLSDTLSTPFRSAELHATVALIYNAVGSSAVADSYAAMAVKLNPVAIDDIEWLRIKLPEPRRPRSN